MVHRKPRRAINMEKQYEIKWTLEKWFKVTITAESEEQAREMFWAGEHGEPTQYGAEIQEGVDVEEVK
jgi:hypothetical protein